MFCTPLGPSLSLSVLIWFLVLLKSCWGLKRTGVRVRCCASMLRLSRPLESFALLSLCLVLEVTLKSYLGFECTGARELQVSKLEEIHSSLLSCSLRHSEWRIMNKHLSFRMLFSRSSYANDRVRGVCCLTLIWKIMYQVFMFSNNDNLARYQKQVLNISCFGSQDASL